MSHKTLRRRIRGDYRPLDNQVGFRVHLKRVLAQMPERQLADILHVDPHFISEYEQGVKPIHASMLYHISVILRVPIANFFTSFSDDFDLDEGPVELGFDTATSSCKEQDQNFINDENVVRLVKAYNSIKDPSAKQRMLELMIVVAED